MPRVLDIDAARELRGLIAELRDEMLSDVLAGKSFGAREIARVQRTLEILNSGDFSAQMAETYSKYQGWAFDEGVAQIDGMLKGLDLSKTFNLPPSVFDAAAASYPSKVVTIVPQLHDELSRVLRLGMTGMRTPEQVKNDIQRRFSVAASRAQTIATTEIKGMQNTAQESRITEAFRAAGENGVPMVKTWIHSSGQRVGFLKTAKRIGYQPRPHHKAMHGVTVRQGELFTLTAPSGVYMITGPHDEPLPAEEVVSCHCGRGIEIDRERYRVRTAPVAQPAKPEVAPAPAPAPAPPKPKAPPKPSSPAKITEPPRVEAEKPKPMKAGEADKYFRETGQIKKLLTPDELRAMEVYKDNGYRYINGYLRDAGSVSAKDAKQLKGFVKGMDESFKKAPPLEKAVTVHRGMLSEEFAANARSLVGKTIQDKAFLSTTADKKIAQNFLKGGDKGKVLFNIDVPKGTRGVYMENVKELRTNEMEFLLNRNSKIKILSVTEETVGGKVVTIINAEAV